MTLKITTLVENTLGEHLALHNEHGISFYIEKDEHALLFDVGQTNAFIHNADQLRIDLSAVKNVIISHGHYDHSGGLRCLSELTSNFDLTLGQGFFAEKFGLRDGVYEFIGNNFDENFLKDRGISYSLMSTATRELVPGVHVVTNFSRKNADETVNPRVVLQENGSFIKDSFNDEVLVAIETPKGMVVALGCSHPGVKNMLDTVLELFDKPLYAVLGGTHLVEATPESIELTATYLQEKNVQQIGVSHCTGPKGMKRLAQFKGKYFQNSTGCSLIVEYRIHGRIGSFLISLQELQGCL